MIQTDTPITYVCPECHCCGDLRSWEFSSYQLPLVDRAEESCSLCKGRGRVTVREIIEYYVIEAD